VQKISHSDEFAMNLAPTSRNSAKNCSASLKIHHRSIAPPYYAAREGEERKVRKEEDLGGKWEMEKPLFKGLWGAAGPGFEPGLTDPESVVLPLLHLTVKMDDEA
jgi:hypothetical protein